MTNHEPVKIEDLRGILYDPATADIPSEYRVGLGRGRLGDWMQEVHDAGWDVRIDPYNDDTGEGGGVAIGRAGSVSYWGMDDDTHNVEFMFVRAFIAWRKRQ